MYKQWLYTHSCRKNKAGVINSNGESKRLGEELLRVHCAFLATFLGKWGNSDQGGKQIAKGWRGSALSIRD